MIFISKFFNCYNLSSNADVPGVVQGVRYDIQPSKFNITFFWETPRYLGSAFRADLDYKFDYCKLIGYEVPAIEYRNVSVLIETKDDKNNNNVRQKKGERKIELRKFNVKVMKYRKESCEQLITG